MRRKLLIALPVLALLLIALLMSTGGGDLDLRGRAQDFILERGDPSWGPLWDFAGGLPDLSDIGGVIRMSCPFRPRCTTCRVAR